MSLTTYDITIDFDNVIFKKPPPKVYYSDGIINTTKFRFYLKKSGVAVDLTSVTASIEILTSEYRRVSGVAVVLDAINGVIEYTFNANEMAVGKNYCELTLKLGSIKKTTSRIHYFVT